MALQHQLYLTPQVNSLPMVRLDTLPEGMVGRSYYKDTGCDLAPSCLNCPFKQCRFDMDSKTEQIVKRTVVIVEMREVGLSVRAISAQIGISERMVYQSLQGAAI